MLTWDDPDWEPCTNNVLSWAPGSICRDCGHTSLVHPGVNDATECAGCTLQAMVRAMHGIGLGQGE